MNTHREQIEATLRSRGVLSATELAQALGVSQPTISRAISGTSRQRIVNLGGGRSRRYALRRPVRELGSEWPLYNIMPDGEIRTTGRLYSLAPQQWHFQQDTAWDSLRGSEFSDGIYPGLPWFLNDLRPQGFLGRAFARHHAAILGTSTDPRNWNNDDILSALVRFGSDLPGSFIIGDNMLAEARGRIQGPAEAIPHETRDTTYPSMADAIINDGLHGSSAAGEQPKFSAFANDSKGNAQHVIVKFSGRNDRPEDRRWADLLIAENLANKILSSIGIPCAKTSILWSDGRTFLESRRFDREENHGRRGLVSLAALDGAFFGEAETTWLEAAGRLRSDGWITSEDTENLQTLWWFGTLIGNSDMHYGNASFHLSPDRPLSLAPTYDMVPMQYRPNQEGLLPNEAIDPPPPATVTPAWSQAREAAVLYWQTLSNTQQISPDFIQIAERNAQAIKKYRNQFT